MKTSNLSEIHGIGSAILSASFSLEKYMLYCTPASRTLISKFELEFGRFEFRKSESPQNRRQASFFRSYFGFSRFRSLLLPSPFAFLARGTGIPAYCDTGYCDKPLIVTASELTMGPPMSDNVTIPKCDTFAW